MNDTEETFIASLRKSLQEYEVYIFITRDSGLQENACIDLEALLIKILEAKKTAIIARNEDHANLLLGFEFATQCLISILRMWLCLKKDNPDAAWTHLISAQSSASSAAKAHNSLHHMVELFNYLEGIEAVVFPPQVFTSIGMIVECRECSICGQEYGDCDHIVGRPYMGKLCHTIVKNMQVNHIAIVDKPANKHCRITHFSAPGGKRNRMTWRIEPEEKPEGSDSMLEPSAILATGVIGDRTTLLSDD